MPSLKEAVTPRVKPEYGPTLFELLAPYGKPVKVAVAAVAAIVVLIVGMSVLGGDDEKTIVNREGTKFNLVYKGALKEREVPGALVSLERTRGDLFLDAYRVRPLKLPAYRGAASGTLPLYAVEYLKQLRTEYEGVQLDFEGRTRINNGIGYQLLFRAKRDGRTLYVRHILLVPEDPIGSREGVVIVLETTPSATPNLDATGTYSPLKTPYRSFRFGTERKGGEA